MTNAEFEMLDEILSQGSSPAMPYNELISWDTTDAERAGTRLEVLRGLEHRGHVEITPWIEGEKLVSVTALGLRAFGRKNGSDPATVEAAISEIGLK